MGNLKKKAFITEIEQEAIDFVSKFDENVTGYSYNGTEYIVIVRIVDSHFLTQTERELLVEIPKDFF